MSPDTSLRDSLAAVLERYEALAQVSADFLGHGSPVLTLLDTFNHEFRSLLDDSGASAGGS